MEYQPFLPGLEKPGFSVPEVVQALTAFDQRLKQVERMFCRKRTGVRVPEENDRNQRFWVWVKDVLPEPEFPPALSRWDRYGFRDKVMKKHRAHFVSHLRYLAECGVIEMAGQRPWYRFRVPL